MMMRKLIQIKWTTKVKGKIAKVKVRMSPIDIRIQRLASIP